MSDIVLSASVRQNLLSLQSTADLLATTQNRLATGKKVNTALDNPTNYFTAAALDSRAGDINNLLDGIGNGVQILQAANTGITSLQKLVDSAKSVANQALQTTVGYTKSTVSTGPNPGATAANILGTAPPTNNTVTGAVVNNDDTGGAAPITGATNLAGAAGAGSDNLATNFVAGDTLVINGITIAFNSGAGTTGVAADGTLSIDVTTGTVQNVLTAIDAITGTAVPSTITGGQITLSTGTASDLTVSGSGLSKLGLGAVSTVARTPGVPALAGKTLTIDSTGGGTPTNLTFGTGPGQISSLNQLNAKLLANNLQASIDSTGAITITTSNDAASYTIGAIGGTAAAATQLFNGLTIANPVADPTSQDARAKLVDQYNHIIEQISTTAGDASFNGVNLLAGDQLKLVFNETGKSTLNITGTSLNPAGLGLSTLTSGTDFIDNVATNKVLAQLQGASSLLRSQASTLGSNLSIVQIRQDFSKNLINVLQTGSANLTIADTNEEAANSQALATRQSIAVSALALANQSQQSVLKLLQ
ncbi:flagellar protein [Afipia sp. Root123D2]|uniref:flagellin N-terminal helical domain-containing protein n=1 Tax=Afipia sp. Root123D2 TaxID=1736436 RepID=UPI0006F4CCBA|nr:flagellin [Afipia sp. Root123D2]KQW22361.1 flagellar protein [Afipia sp. Root123D2]